MRRQRARVRGRPAPQLIEPVPDGGRSVWQFPRPPRIALATGTYEVRCGFDLIARTDRAIEVCETSGAPVPYFPIADTVTGIFRETNDWALCEWKGVSIYLDVSVGQQVVPKAAWYFPAPFTDLGEPYTRLLDYVAFQPQAFTCTVDHEVALPQPGRYYGGWITSDIAGPFKGGPGTEQW